MTTQNNPQEIEMEAKNMLTKEEFDILITRFDIQKASFEIKRNAYFVDKERKLREKLPPGTTLRLCRKGESEELQLKIPNGDTVEEFKDIVDEKIYEELMEEGKLPDVNHSNVSRKLSLFGINPPFEYIGELSTMRAKARLNISEGWEKARIYLDESIFLGGYSDYEIEVESDISKEESLRILKEILRDHNIPERETKSKIERFFDYTDAI